MHLDLETLGLVLFVVFMGNGLLSALMAWSGRTFPGAWLWVSGQGTLTLGVFLMFLGPWVPPWLSVVVGNSSYVAAAVLFCHAVWTFRFIHRFPRWIYGILPVIFLSFTLTLDQDYLVREVVFSFWGLLGACSVGILLLWNVKRPYRMANAVTSLPFLTIGLISLVRIALSLMGRRGSEDFFTIGGMNTYYLLGSILILTVTLFGYFMMSGIKSDQALQEKDGEIRARNQKLIESSRAKDLFFSIIAHDLRGPIGGAARYARKHLLGKMTGLEAKYTEVEILAAALEKTNEFLEKLLWWSRAQLQDWAPDRLAVDLDQIFSQTLALVQSGADLKEIPIQVAPGPYPAPWADPESVQLILGNLLTNAVKFSLPGHPIRISVETSGEICRITVADEGVGMDRRTLERLFKIEDKLTTHGTSGERGSGLGLLLAQGLAARNDGGITMESGPGTGTRATLWLPLHPVEGPT